MIDVEKLFAYAHLPTHLQTVSQNFHTLALHLDQSLPDCAAKTLALRKLWEAKNYAVWVVAQPRMVAE